MNLVVIVIVIVIIVFMHGLRTAEAAAWLIPYHDPTAPTFLSTPDHLLSDHRLQLPMLHRIKHHKSRDHKTVQRRLAALPTTEAVRIRAQRSTPQSARGAPQSPRAGALQVQVDAEWRLLSPPPARGCAARTAGVGRGLERARSDSPEVICLD